MGVESGSNTAVKIGVGARYWMLVVAGLSGARQEKAPVVAGAFGVKLD